MLSKGTPPPPWPCLCMAAVSIPPSPHAIGMMASRRVPLSNVPNAANSPLRPLAGKRGRSQSNATEDAQGGQPPPNKKQILDLNAVVPRTPTRRQPQATALRRVDGIPEKKPQGAREREAAGRTTRQEKTENESQNQETIRQWQKHYRKVFPSYVFFFDNVPEDFLRHCSRGVAGLGAVRSASNIQQALLIFRIARGEILLTRRYSCRNQPTTTNRPGSIYRHNRTIINSSFCPRRGSTPYYQSISSR